jgi:hypothetical protein
MRRQGRENHRQRRPIYIDTLLMLLLMHLMRCASNFATPRQPFYVKGGLPAMNS